MELRIKNIDRMIGTQFWNGIFFCTKAYESETNYRFQFKDTRDDASRIVWVEINKNGRWDDEAGDWTYNLNYPNIKSHHLVTANWFSDWANVMETFGSALKKSI